MNTTADKRHSRKIASREAMLHAGLQLIGAGNWRPTARQVAGQSGRSVRTFFSAFPSIEAYYEELMQTHGTTLRIRLDLATREYNENRYILNGAIDKLLRLILTGKGNT